MGDTFNFIGNVTAVVGSGVFPIVYGAYKLVESIKIDREEEERKKRIKLEERKAEREEEERKKNSTDLLDRPYVPTVRKTLERMIEENKAKEKEQLEESKRPNNKNNKGKLLICSR